MTGISEEPEDEFWYRCKDCEGTGVTSVPTDASQRTYAEGQCADCGGLGFFQGEAGGEQYGFVRISANDPNELYPGN
jgi:DnaJ-class molecular chaperone